MNFLAYFKKKRDRINRDLRDKRIRKFFSPALLCLDKSFFPLARKYLEGARLDVGCGDQPYRSFIESPGAKYASVDIEVRWENVTYISDIHDMGIVPQESFDRPICIEVLEYVANPFVVVDEIAKVLRPSGNNIIRATPKSNL